MTNAQNRSGPIKDIIIVGGGTAGWLTACHLARALLVGGGSDTRLTVVESPNVPTIGVGEGTVPSIVDSLKHIGISESDLISQCDATFKQSIRFIDWRKPGIRGEAHAYYHVFDYPGLERLKIAPYWLTNKLGEQSFVDTISLQGKICDEGLAPKLMTHPEYRGLCGYAYHFDAAKLAVLLTNHAKNTLGVNHVVANVQSVELDDRGFIESVVTDRNGVLVGDFFVDCTGFFSLLIGGKLGAKFVDKSDILFTDNALAIQVPYQSENTPIPCYTKATAQDAGWIWDIGLSTRRGTGYVYSAQHCSSECAKTALRSYLRQSVGRVADELACRRIPMKVGFLEECWLKNCVAVGLSQGFVEPLEATGILMIDDTARTLAALFPSSADTIATSAKKFNEIVRYQWDRIIDFIKLHYFLSDRDDSEFWQDNRSAKTVPATLMDNLRLWKERPPSEYDFPRRNEVFYRINYMYILYGMRFDIDQTSMINRATKEELRAAQRVLARNSRESERILAQLVPHRELINRIKKHGLQKV